MSVVLINVLGLEFHNLRYTKILNVIRSRKEKNLFSQ
jgi:hypothetical protein